MTIALFILALFAYNEQLLLRVQLAREIKGKYLELMAVRFSRDDSNLVRMTKPHLAVLLIA